MKKSLTKSLMAVGIVGLFGLTSVAVAAEFNWNGSIRAGYKSNNTGGTGDKAAVNLGADTGSRIGVDASTDLGNGQSAGAELSYLVDGADLSVRRQNVFVGGGWGKLTLGKQGGIYRSAANWDQSYFHGGNIRFGGDVNGATGLTYASNIPGPFSFDIEVVSYAGVGAVDAVELVTGTVTVAPGATGGPTTAVYTITPAVKEVKAISSKGIGQWAATAHYNFGIATLNLGYHANTVRADNKVNRWGVDGSYNNTAISINGSAGGFGYYVAYEVNKANPSSAAQIAAPLDGKTVGIFLSYGFDNNVVYLEYENAKIDNNVDDPQATLVGYSLGLGQGVTLIAEYVTVNEGANIAKPSTLNLSLKYDF